MLQITLYLQYSLQKVMDNFKIHSINKEMQLEHHLILTLLSVNSKGKWTLVVTYYFYALCQFPFLFLAPRCNRYNKQIKIKFLKELSWILYISTDQWWYGFWKCKQWFDYHTHKHARARTRACRVLIKQFMCFF